MRTLIIGILLCATLNFAIAADEFAVIPLPQKIEAKEGVMVLSSKTVIHADKAGKPAAELLAARLRTATGYAFKVDDKINAKSGIVLVSDKTVAPGAEGYALEVTKDKAVIRATDAAGLFYGTQTLLQLLPPEVFSAGAAKSVNWQLSCVSITDTPRFPWRGIMLDVSRHFLTVDEVKRFLDVMGLHKLNIMHFHLTDDQGWRLEIKKYPKLTEHGSIRSESPAPGNRNKGDGKPYGPFFYTQDQIRDLVAYAQARHITIIPEIEMPGHVLGVISSFPELSCRGVPIEVRTRWGVEPDVLCVGNPASLEFMEDVLKETLELFPSKFIHIGGDESPRDRWKECVKCQALLKAEGYKNEAQLQTWFNHRIEKYLADNGRRLIGWDEILEGGLTPGAAVMSWRGIGGGIEAATHGHDVVMSPTSHCYLDYGQGRGPNEPETIGGYLPLETVYFYEPVPEKLPADKKKHVLGLQGNLWSEYLWTLKDFEYNGFPRACAIAEIGWTSAEQKDFGRFTSRLGTHLKRLDMFNMNYRKLDAPPVGEWKPTQIKSEPAPVEWDVTAATKSAGRHVAELNFTHGAHGIDIAWVALLQDGKEISRDVHAGFAGGRPRATSYTLQLPTHKPGVRYTLRAQVSGNGGTDSAGVVNWTLKPAAQ